jgi:hypothetical protein
VCLWFPVQLTRLPGVMQASRRCTIFSLDIFYCTERNQNCRHRATTLSSDKADFADCGEGVCQRLQQRLTSCSPQVTKSFTGRSSDLFLFSEPFPALPALAEAMADKASGIISEPNWKSQQRELLPNFRGPVNVAFNAGAVREARHSLLVLFPLQVFTLKRNRETNDAPKVWIFQIQRRKKYKQDWLKSFLRDYGSRSKVSISSILLAVWYVTS